MFWNEGVLNVVMATVKWWSIVMRLYVYVVCVRVHVCFMMKEDSRAWLSHSLLLNHPVERTGQWPPRLTRFALIALRDGVCSTSLPSNNHKSRDEPSESLPTWSTTSSRTRQMLVIYFLIVNKSHEKTNTLRKSAFWYFLNPVLR